MEYKNIEEDIIKKFSFRKSKLPKLLLEYGVQYNLKDDCDRFFEEHPELLKKKECNKEEIILKITDLLKSL